MVYGEMFCVYFLRPKENSLFNISTSRMDQAA